MTPNYKSIRFIAMFSRRSAGNLTKTEGLGLPNVLVPKSVPEFDVVEMLADETCEGGPQDAVAEGVLRQCGWEEVDVIHRPEERMN